MKQEILCSHCSEYVDENAGVFYDFNFQAVYDETEGPSQPGFNISSYGNTEKKFNVGQKYSLEITEIPDEIDKLIEEFNEDDIPF